MQIPTPAVIRAELVLDLICSASYITFTRLIHVIDRLHEHGRPVNLTFLPFELDPGGSTEGVPVLEELRELFGPDADRQAAAIAHQAIRDGLVLNYDRAIATGTFDAHRLVMLAQQQDRGVQMVERLFRAHFTDGLHIGDADTLRRLAAEVGVEVGVEGGEDVDEGLKRQLERVRAHGIRAVPVLLLDSQPPVTGTQTEERLWEVLEREFSLVAGH